MELKTFIEKVKTTPDSVAFTDIISAVEANYKFVETGFKNGDTYNEPGENSGSCKLFALAKLNNLSVEETLACFGDYYRKDVLENPDGSDHQNIRNFITYGWDGIAFEGEALEVK